MRTPITRVERLAAYFILIALILLLVMVLRPGYERFATQSLLVRVIADDAAGLERGDQVSMRGLQIGEIQDLDLLDLTRLKPPMEEVINALGAEGSHKVLITCEVYRRYADKITRAVTFSVEPPAILGSGKMVVRPGDGTGWLAAPDEPDVAGARANDEVRSGDYVLARTTGSLGDNANRLIDRATVLVDNANDQVTQIGTTLDAVEKSVTGTLAKVEESVTGTLGQLGDDLGGTLGNVDQNLEEVVTALENSLKGIDDVVGLLKTGDGSLAMLLNRPDLHRDLQGLVAEVGKVLAEIDAPGLVADVKAPVLETLARLPGMADSLVSSLGHLEASLATLEQGLAPLPPATAGLVVTLADLRKVVESVKRLALIDNNLPADPSARTMAPISPRRTDDSP